VDPALKRRLDVLVVLQAVTIGIAVTVLFATEFIGPLFLSFALLPTVAILLVAYVYIDRAAEARAAPDGTLD
jgi:hypothetical protein